MQQIERYGVIALVFLLVTIVAVSFWGDGKSPGFWSRLTGRGAKKTPEATQTSSLIPPASTSERAIETELPLSAFRETQATPSASAPTYGPMPVEQGWTTGAADQSGWMTNERTTTARNTLPLPSSGTPSLPSSRSERLASAPAPVAAPRKAEYVVQKGDSLLRIAAKTLGSANRWREIQALNAGVDPRSLRVGMKLALPAAAVVQKSVPAPKAGGSARNSPPPSKDGASLAGSYVVRSGDTLESIAARVLGDGDRWKEIAAANPGLDPRRLFVGKSLRMPARGSSAKLAVRTPLGEAPLVAAARPSSSNRPRVR